MLRCSLSLYTGWRIWEIGYALFTVCQSRVNLLCSNHGSIFIVSQPRVFPLFAVTELSYHVSIIALYSNPSSIHCEPTQGLSTVFQP